MKIRKLEIQGFKSFVDRTVLTFDHDVTAIVGPNGCGKSNTVDAIRWCMGEQSARHLRGKSMEDVIFAGSETRPPHSFAEVTLTFDNRDGLAPPEYSAYSEISVTRRLTRNGESEYFINKVPVRWMDVVNLFLGTGAGTKAYSVVEQGRIGLIVTSKPEDRRALLEEAAGITRYKARKKATEKKIEQTRQNLLRVGDILAEIEKSLATLKRQAQKAERYKAYRAELRDIELYLASHRLLELVAVSKVTMASLERAEAEQAGVTAALIRIEAEGESLRVALFDAEQALETAQRVSFQADNEVTRLEAELQRLRDQLAAARRREGDASKELAEIAAQREILTAERDQLKSELVHLEQAEREADERLADAEENLRTLRERLSDAEARLSQHRQTIMEAERVIAGVEAARDALARRKLETESRRTRWQGEERSLRKRLNEIEQERAAAAERLAQLTSERERMVLERSQLEAQLAPLRDERDALERRLSEVRQERDRTMARLHALREISSRHEGVGKGVRAVLEAGRRDVLGLLIDALAVPASLAPAVAAVLADRWQDVLVSAPEGAVAIVDWLRRGDRGRVALVPEMPPRGEALPAHPPMPGVVGMLFELIGGEREVPGPLWEVLRPVVLVDSLGAALDAWRTQGSGRMPYRYVTRDGDVLEPSGRITGGSPERAGAGLLATHAEIRSLEPRVEALEQSTLELTEQLDRLRDQLRRVQQRLEGIRADLHAQELSIVTVERDVKAHEAEAARASARLETLGREIGEIDAALQEMAREELQLEASYSEAVARRDAAREGLLTDEAEMQAWRDEVERASARVTDAKVLVTRARERSNGVRNTVARLERSAQELHVREERLRSELRELARTQGAAAGQWMVLREALVASVEEARRRRDELQARRVHYDGVRNALGEMEAQIRAVRTRKEALDKHVGALQMRAREEALAAEHLIDAVAEKHGVVLPRIVGDYHLRPAPDESHQARMEELRQLIERMGDVNLTAIEEYAEQEKRHAFYMEQKADLDRALAQLEEAIEEMNRESKRRFKETFDAVNENFQKLFPRLFRGGRGALQLSNPDDLLETGVEIVAQPPGKKLVNLEAMSGGEKTLTAVTLLFALFMYRPSPFCLLDEVEAALDEANVIRLCELIRELTDRSQFILITHNKRTMAMADVLYGVTMEEPGVSKLVGVKLKTTDERPDGQSASAVA